MIDGKAAEQRRRNPRITRKLLCKRRREIIQHHAGGGKRVIAANCGVGQVNGDEAGGEAAPYILSDLLMEVAVEGFDAAGKRWPVMIRAKRFDVVAVRRRHLGRTASR